MATGGNEQTASPLAEFGSFSVKDSAVNSTIHLCQCRDGSKEAYADKVRAIRAAALVWPKNLTPPSGLPGVKVLPVGADWDEVVGGLQEAERLGYRSVAVWAGGGSLRLLLDGYIEKLSDYVASHRPAAATDIWVVYWNTEFLSSWQWEMSDDARYQCL